MKFESAKFTQNSKISSFVIFKRVISFLCEKAKLSLIKQNKKIQKALNIDIEYFKKVSQRYRIIQENGKRQEFLINTNYLIFEGEYKNGKKHGKGYEYYYNNNLEQDDKYLKWEKREQKINNYFKGNLKFKGEYF